MNRAALERIDSFPYRHRLADVMSSPVASAPGTMTLGEAARLMEEGRISSLLVEGDRPGVPAGIVTERDLLRACATWGPGALSKPLREVMSSPVQGLPPDAFVHLAIGRMERLGIRHVVALDDAGRALGIVTARTLLRQRASKALALGDEISVAAGPLDLAHDHAGLPALAEALLAEGVPVLDVAGVIAGVLRSMTARAAELAAAEVEALHGPAPAPWCVLVLGSAGRGETLLAGDQDNAIVHGGSPDDDPWYAAVGDRLCAILDRAGIPFCKGGVMASSGLWRHDLAGWKRQVERWISAPEGENLLDVDIFFDFQPVHGDRLLAEELRAHALDRAARSQAFLKNLGQELEKASPPLRLFGFRTEEGRVDLKLGGLWPVVAGARVLALREGIRHTATAERIEALADGGRLARADADALLDLLRRCMGLMLDQQVADVRAGVHPSPRVDPRRLDRAARRGLRRALGHVGRVSWIVRDAIAGA
jgi:signal-transduction protein with cAMP-binding, CBS, and nucleotidyltransferase domain